MLQLCASLLFLLVLLYKSSYEVMSCLLDEMHRRDHWIWYLLISAWDNHDIVWDSFPAWTWEIKTTLFFNALKESCTQLATWRPSSDIRIFAKMLARMARSEMASATWRKGFEVCNLVRPTGWRVFRAQNPCARLRALSSSMEPENRWIWRISGFSWDNPQIADVDLVPKFEK